MGASIGERRLADTVVAPPARVAAPLRPSYLAAAAAVAVMIAAIRGDSLWFLNFVHVMTGALWTGIDLFMGFVIGPVLRRVSLDTRRAMIAGIIPRTLILMPTLSAITSTAGWFLAVRLGFLDLGYPEFWWVIAALAIVTVLTVQGLGYLLPMNLKLYFEIQKPAPDHGQDRPLDAHLRAGGGGAGHHAGRHHRGDGALRHRAFRRVPRANPMRSISGAASRSITIFIDHIPGLVYSQLHARPISRSRMPPICSCFWPAGRCG